VFSHANAACLLCLGKPLEYFYRHLYLPEQGMFKALPGDMELGTYLEDPTPPVPLGLLQDKGKVIGFVKDGVSFRCAGVSCADG